MTFNELAVDNRYQAILIQCLCAYREPNIDRVSQLGYDLVEGNANELCGHEVRSGMH